MKHFNFLWVLLALVLVIGVTSAVTKSPTHVFIQIKEMVLKTDPDKDGDYWIRREDDKYVYVIGYTSGHLPGCAITDKEAGGSLVIVFDENDGAYVIASVFNGNILSERLISEEKATAMAEEIFRRFQACTDPNQKIL
jgi:hypothetical protein